jgi:hypothetical protein
MNNLLDYYQNENILKAIRYEMNYIQTRSEREDCKQEIFAELYDFMPLDEYEAIKIVRKASRRFRRKSAKNYITTASYKDGLDWLDMGYGRYERKAHWSPAD